LWELGNTEEASHHYLKVFELREKIGNPYKIALTLNAMVEMALHNKNYSRAHNYVRKLKEIGDSTGNYSILENTVTLLGDIKAADGEHRTKIQYYTIALAFSMYLTASKQL